MSRVKKVKMTKSFSNKDKFPYNSDDLAMYMYKYLNSGHMTDEEECSTYSEES